LNDLMPTREEILQQLKSSVSREGKGKDEGKGA
jgi:hypothetical protein